MLKPYSQLARGRALLNRARRRYFPTILDRVLLVPGWTQECQLQTLMSRVKSLPDRAVIVEVGVWQGRSALAMAEACRNTHKKVFAVDPWTEYTQSGISVGSRLQEWQVNSFEEVFAGFLTNRKAFGLEPWLTPVRAPSVTAAKNWVNGPIDMIFIDGNHDYDAVIADLEAWLPLVKPGGLVSGDDWVWESVRTAVADFLMGLPEGCLELPCDNTWLFTRPAVKGTNHNTEYQSPSSFVS